MHFSVCIEVNEFTEQKRPSSAQRELTYNVDYTNTSIRPLANFLAHLVATQAQAPQARKLRRADPKEAIEAYRAQFAAPGKRSSMVLSV